MLMYRFFSCASLVFISLAGYGQQKGQMEVSGVVNDKQGAPVAFATVGAFTIADSAYISGITTEDNGAYTLEIPTGKYFLKVTMMGYQDGYITLPSSKKKIALPTVTLQDDATKIDEVVVSTEGPQMQLQLDKRVFNVGSNPNNAGANATEVLESIPSVTVDAEGNVSLRGKENVRIMIDGKFSGMAASPDALQQLQASMIDKIEVVTNASARYDAQGETGIINIILKKNKKAGWNGSINGNIGYNPQYGGGFNVNYRKGNLNIYGNYAVSQREQPGTSTTYQRYMGADTSFIYRQEYEHLRNKFSNNAMAGVDYSFNDYNTLSASFAMRTGLGNNSYYRKYSDFSTSEKMLGSSVRDEQQKELEDFYEATLSYKKTFTQKGRSFSADVKWSSDQDLERSDYTETSSYYTETSREHSAVNTQEKNYLLQADYIHPFGKDGKIEAGYRSTLRHISNGFTYGQMVGDEYQYPERFNDDYRYLENIHAAYLMAGNKFGRFSVQAGLRAELSDITTKQMSLNVENNRNYLSFFPSAALSYKLTDKNDLQLSYSRRVDRPGQWELLPFTKFGDNREMMLGNPNLNPVFINSFEAGVLQTFGQGSLLSSIYYRNANDVIQRLRTMDESGRVLLMAENLAVQNSYGFEFNFNYVFNSWLKLNSGLNLFRQQTTGSFQGQDLSADAFTFTNRTALNATIARLWRAQTSFNYRAPQKTTQGKMLSNYHMDISLSREILKGNGNLVFNVRDVFNSRRFRSITDTDEFYTETNFQWRPRSFQLSFTYRFNQRPGQHEERQRPAFEDAEG